MANENLLDMAAAVLDEARPAEGGTYALYVEDHKIRLCRWPMLQGHEKVVARLNQLDINKGPTSATWSRIENELRWLQRQKAL